MIKAVRGVVHDNLKPREAYQLFLELKQQEAKSSKRKAVAKK
jgi:hypothetical protein